MEKITPYHAKYFAHELSIIHSGNSVDRLSQSLFDASVDLNPHQIEAALFALDNPLNKGVVLADEVGLGKTIEAGLVLCQLWAERKRKLLIICPASLRRQWAQELVEKFNLPSQVLDARTYIQLQKEGVYNPFNNKHVVIISYHYAARHEDKLIGEVWDIVVIDEAHKLRNAHRESNKIGQALKRALSGRKKLLLTATPLQNSLIELYGVSTLIDEHIFGDDKAFRKQFMQGGSNQEELKGRLKGFIKRTLRKDVLEYIKYTKRKTITIPYIPSDQEQMLYDSISTFLDKDNSYALPQRHKHLTGLILRKLLASSSYAILNTLRAMKYRLEELQQLGEKHQDDFLHVIIEDDDLSIDSLDEDISTEREKVTDTIDFDCLDLEIKELIGYIAQAESIQNDEKSNALLKALELGFTQMAEMGAAKKVIIFTESKRTQTYLASFLEENGFKDEVVSFNGLNTHPEATEIYKLWCEQHTGSDKATGSPQIDRRSALIDYFKEHAKIMIATEAASEGVNLQFCSLLVNYDLPWNPQRVEQRIGRCHRYGQKFDVVVINFINKRNYADQRVLELLTNKFTLFDGVFGASDSILGSLESGVDFEKRIQQIYQECRSPEAIDTAFNQLQNELEDDINAKMKQTQDSLLKHFDEDIHDLLKIKLDQAKERLDKVSRWFWQVTKFQLDEHTSFNEQDYTFTLTEKPVKEYIGKYQLIRKVTENDVTQQIDDHAHTYRITHPLGEYVIEKARQHKTPVGHIYFNYQNNPTKVSVAEQLKGQSGWLSLNLLRIEAFQIEEHIIFTGMTDKGQLIYGEDCKKLFNVRGNHSTDDSLKVPSNLIDNQERQLDAKISEVVEINNQFFHDERDKLEKWADDKIFSAELALQDTKSKRNALKKESRLAVTIDEQRSIQLELKALEVKQRKQRRNIFDLEDEVISKRDDLIDKLESRLKQITEVQNLFTIRWTVN
jgi:superfamily II DNA or RNA helicase